MPPSWKQFIKGHAPNAKFGPPASESNLIAVEQLLGVRLPVQLREFLLEADGIATDDGTGVIWPVDQIQKCNLQFRTLETFRDLYMPFDHLLFFGDDGGGDQFAFAIHADGEIHKNDIFRWEHETDARSWYAGSLEQFLET